MKKNLPFSLLVLFTVFAGISCNTAYQSQLLQYKTYCINNKEQKKSAGLTIIKSHSYSVNKSMNDIASIAKKIPEKKQPVGTPGNLMADKLKKEESCGMVIPSSHPGDQYKEGNKVSDEILAKETRDVDVIIGGHIHHFFDNRITYKYKKTEDIIVNQVGRAGIVFNRLDFEFTKFSGKKLANSHTISVSQKTGG